MGRSTVHADDANGARTRRLRAASRAAFSCALVLPAVATVLGVIPEHRGAVIVGTLLLPLLLGAMLANLVGWSRPLADKARIYLGVGLVFALWSGAAVLSAAAAS
jgi:hypothetical protein